MSAEPTVKSSSALYIKIWVGLAILMLIGVGVAEMPISKSAVVLIVLALSSVKAALVALYYMHLKADQRLLALVALVPFVLIICALCVVFSSRLVRL